MKVLSRITASPFDRVVSGGKVLAAWLTFQNIDLTSPLFPKTSPSLMTPLLHTELRNIVNLIHSQAGVDSTTKPEVVASYIRTVLRRVCQISASIGSDGAQLESLAVKRVQDDTTDSVTLGDGRYDLSCDCTLRFASLLPTDHRFMLPAYDISMSVDYSKLSGNSDRSRLLNVEFSLDTFSKVVAGVIHAKVDSSSITVTIYESGDYEWVNVDGSVMSGNLRSIE